VPGVESRERESVGGINKARETDSRTFPNLITKRRTRNEVFRAFFPRSHQRPRKDLGLRSAIMFSKVKETSEGTVCTLNIMTALKIFSSREIKKKSCHRGSLNLVEKSGAAVQGGLIPSPPYLLVRGGGEADPRSLCIR